MQLRQAAYLLDILNSVQAIQSYLAGSGGAHILAHEH
jgi:hypothetical protein